MVHVILLLSTRSFRTKNNKEGINIKLHVSKLDFKRKPQEKQISRISATILNEVTTIDIEELAQEISEKGKTVVLAEFKGQRLSDAQFVGQELVMLDFDNNDISKQYTIEDLEQDEFMNDYACFFYRTFSDAKSKLDKFRVVFKLDNVVHDSAQISKIYQELFKKYPQADTSVGQPSRLFFGGNQSYEVIDLDNVLVPNELFENSDDFSDTIEDSNNRLANYLLLRDGKYDVVQSKLCNGYAETFSDEYSAYQYFKTLDIRELLELPVENPFLDILHEESNPSASVYYEKKQDIYFYKCFSQNSNDFTGDIVKLLVNYLGLRSNAEAIKLLVMLTGSEITYDSEIGIEECARNEFIERLENGMIQQLHKEMYYYLKYYKNEIVVLLEQFYDFSFEKDNQRRFLNYQKIKRLSTNIKKVTHKQISDSKMFNIITVLTSLELIKKVNDNLPLEINNVIEEQKNSEQIRTSNVYEPVCLTREAIEHSSHIAKKLRENQVTVSSLSYETIYRLFGETKAKQDFPQAYEPLVESGLIRMSSSDANLTSKSIVFEQQAIKLIFKHIDKNGYVFESDLFNELALKNHVSHEAIKKRFAKVRSSILNDYDLKRMRLTDKLHKQYKMKIRYTAKNIIFRSEELSK